MYLPLFLIMLEKFESAFVELSSQVFNLLQIRVSLILRQRIRTKKHREESMFSRHVSWYRAGIGRNWLEYTRTNNKAVMLIAIVPLCFHNGRIYTRDELS